MKLREPPRKAHIFQSEKDRLAALEEEKAKNLKIETLRSGSGKSGIKSGSRNRKLLSPAGQYDVTSSTSSSPVFGQIEYDPEHNVVAQNIADSSKFYTTEYTDNYIFGSTSSILSITHR